MLNSIYLKTVQELTGFLAGREADIRSLSPETVRFLKDSIRYQGAAGEDVEKLEVSDLRLKIRMLLHRLRRFQSQAKRAASYMGQEETVDYYLMDNRLRELSWLGFGWYADCLFETRKATLYKGDDVFHDITWEKNWKYMGEEDKSSGARAVQKMFDFCKKHIEIGNPGIYLSSWSECLGRDLFKYVSLNDEGIAELAVKRNALVNVVLGAEGFESLQNFSMKKGPIEFCDFAIDFGSPRNRKRKNFDSWYYNFMQEEFWTDFESREILNKDEKELSEYFLLRLLNRVERSKSYTQMVSPVADREIVASGTIWGNIEEFSEERLGKDGRGQDDYRDEEAVICFKMNSEELYQLLFCYYLNYSEKKHKRKERFLEAYSQRIEWLEKIFEEQIHSGEDSSDNIQKDIQEARVLYVKELMELWRELPGRAAEPKIRGILSFVSWEEEDIPKKWGIDNIYKKDKANIAVNLYKQLLQWIREEAERP